MAEGARLESVYTETYRGFESLSLRQTAIPFPIIVLQTIMENNFITTYTS